MTKNNDRHATSETPKQFGVAGFVRQHLRLAWLLVFALISIPVVIYFIDTELLEYALDRLAQISAILSFVLALFLAFLDRERFSRFLGGKFGKTVVAIVFDRSLSSSLSVRHKANPIPAWIRNNLLPEFSDPNIDIWLILGGTGHTRQLQRSRYHTLDEMVDELGRDIDDGANTSSGMDLAIADLSRYGRLTRKRIEFITEKFLAADEDMKRFEGVTNGPVLVTVYSFSAPVENKNSAGVIEVTKKQVVLRGRERSWPWCLPFCLLLLLLVFAFRCAIGSFFGYELGYLEAYPNPTGSQRNYIISSTGTASWKFDYRTRSAEALREAYRNLLLKALDTENLSKKDDALIDLLTKLDSSAPVSIEALSSWFRKEANKFSLRVTAESSTAGWLDCCGRAQVKGIFEDDLRAAVDQIIVRKLEETIEQRYTGKWEEIKKESSQKEITVTLSELSQMVSELVGGADIEEYVKNELGPDSSVALVQITQYRELDHLMHYESADFRPGELARLGLEGLARVLDRKVRESSGKFRLQIAAYGSADPKELKRELESRATEIARYVNEDHHICARTAEDVPRYDDGTPKLRIPPQLVEAKPLQTSTDVFQFQISPSPNTVAIGPKISDNCELSVARAFFALGYLMNVVERASSERSDGRNSFIYKYAGYGSKDSAALVEAIPESDNEKRILSELRGVELEITRIEISTEK